MKRQSNLRLLVSPNFYAAGLALYAALVGGVGCQLISGVTSLEVDPTLGGSTSVGGFGGAGGAGGGVGGVGGAGGGAGSAGGCTTLEDCPDEDSLCKVRNCNSGVCGEGSVPAGNPAASQRQGDCSVLECNEAGAVEGVPDILDVYNDGRECTDDFCSSGIAVNEFTSTGAPCTGGVCDGGGKCVQCVSSNECVGGPCQKNVCVSAHCTDMTKNIGESDVDCGGVECAPCADYGGCNVGSDCDSNVCSPSLKTCEPALCVDGVKNGEETSVDCGGPSCAKKCAEGTGCILHADCDSNVCGGGTCLKPTCGDGVKNGAEVGLDCGGVCAPCM